MSVRYVPPNHGDEVEHRRQLAEGVNNALNGKVNSYGSVTLTASAGSTNVTDYRVGTDSVILFMPTTANAAAEMAAGTMYVSSKTIASAYFTITHANNAQTDRDFLYVVLA